MESGRSHPQHPLLLDISQGHVGYSGSAMHTYKYDGAAQCESHQEVLRIPVYVAKRIEVGKVRQQQSQRATNACLAAGQQLHL